MSNRTTIPQANQSIDFKQTAHRLLSRIEIIVSDLVPGGKRQGAEYRAGSVRGGPGSSFGINLTTGLWSDFAEGQSGSDLISLYAEINSVSQVEAAKSLSQLYLGEINIKSSYPQETPQPAAPKPTLVKPPHDANPPEMGKPDLVHEYLGKDSELLFYVSRYTRDGKKTFVPWSYSSENKWVKKMWPDPRPIYNLHLVHKYAEKPILIVEGEKAADAASKITTAYVVVTWSGGAQAFLKTDWSPIYGRNVLIWPDADDPGVKAGEMLALKLSDHCPQVKFINTDQTNGWDAADALADGWTASDFTKWAKRLVQTVEKKPALIPEIIHGEVTRDSDKTVQDPESSPVKQSRKIIYKNWGMEMTHEGTRLLMSTSNVEIFLRNQPEFKDIVWTDTFYNQVLTKWDGETRPWAEIDDINLYILLQKHYDFTKITKNHISDAINSVASKIKRHEPRDWLTSLEWDQTPRLESFFHRALKTKDTEYTRIVCKNFFVGLAARIMDPGCKNDTMVILEGKQGARKSTLASIIGGKWFTEANAEIGSKDFDMSMQGKLLMEIGELDKMSKADIKTTKNKLSQRIDEYRPAYGRSVQKFPRTCVLIGTTNEDDYLDDVTGARRFYPVKVGHIDTEYAQENRDQLFAEALVLYKQGYEWHQAPPMAQEVQESRRKHDSWESVIRGWMAKHPLQVPFPDELSFGDKPLTTDFIWAAALKGDISRLDRGVQNRISKCMKVLGFRNKTTRVKGYSKPLKTWRLHDVNAEIDLKLSENDTLDQEEEQYFYAKPTQPYNFAPGADNSGHDRL